MILLWCLCGILTAFCIARYNQSNKLFWTLFTSFVIGIAGAAVYNKCVQKNQSEVRTTQVFPTQEHSVTKTLFVTFDTEEASCENMPALVSQDNTPDCRSIIIRNQWVKQPTIPPPRLS